MNDIDWCKRHLNWTYVFGRILIITALLLVFGVDYVDTDSGLWLLVGLDTLTTMLLCGWILREKGRSLWWLIFLFVSRMGFLVLLFKNKRGQ